MSEERQEQGRSHDREQTEARPDIAEKVLRYFRANPAAMDSVDGIARFWIHENRQVVEACLEDLHARGLLAKRVIAGTDFYSFPKERLEADRGRPETTVSPGGAVGRILVVDDEPGVRKLLVTALGQAGHTVATAEDGDGAIALLQTGAYDVVVTDVVMPGTSGIDVLKAAKRIRPSTDVLVVTGFADLGTALEALRHGAYDMISKPITDLGRLYRAVGQALERQRLADEARLLVESLQARNRELKDTVARLAAVNEIGAVTAGLLDPDQIYSVLVRLVAQHLNARRASVFITEANGQTMALVGSVGLTQDEALKRKVRIGEGIAGQVAASGALLLVTDIEKTELKELRTGGRYSTSSFMVAPVKMSYPMRYGARCLGVINVSDKHSGDPFNEQDLEFLSTLASQMAVAIENARLGREIENGYLGALAGLIQAVENARPETRGHSRRVAELAGAVAREMRLGESQILALLQAAALHELGRLSRPPEDGAGTAGPARDRWTLEAVMATERVLAPIASLRTVRDIILHSADSVDYAPAVFGVDQRDISLEARILAACEAYAHLTQQRPGDPERARQTLDTLQSAVGRGYDAEVVRTLRRLVESGGIS